MTILAALSVLILMGSAEIPEGSDVQESIEIMVAEEPVIEPDPVLPISRYVDFMEWAEAPQIGLFITENTYGSTGFGGVSGANQKCRELAIQRRYGREEFPGSTRAFLFNNGADVRSWAPSNSLIIRLEDYKRITTYGNFIGESPTLQHSLKRGSDPSSAAWSSVTHLDNPKVTSTCSNWTNNARSFGKGIYIHKTNIAVNVSLPCRNAYRLICMIAMDIYPLNVIDR